MKTEGLFQGDEHTCTLKGQTDFIGLLPSLIDSMYVYEMKKSEKKAPLAVKSFIEIKKSK